MTDPNHSLQDEFDRHFRGDGPPPDTDDAEAAAYHVVFSALQEEPEGDLPDDFAEQVADRVAVGREPALAWTDILMLVLAAAGLGAVAVLIPSALAPLWTPLTLLPETLQTLSSYLRLDVLAAVGLVLALTLGVDALLARWTPLRRAPTPSP